MVKEYEMTGACPIVVGGFGRVEPETGTFKCEMEAAQEVFFLKIGAVRIVRELPEATHAPKPSEAMAADDLVEFEGKKLETWPSGWPRRGTVPDFDPEETR